MHLNILYLNTSSMQCLLIRPLERSSTPVSWILFSLRSSFLREELQESTEARHSQLTSVREQDLNLAKHYLFIFKVFFLT